MLRLRDLSLFEEAKAGGNRIAAYVCSLRAKDLPEIQSFPEDVRERAAN